MNRWSARIFLIVTFFTFTSASIAQQSKITRPSDSIPGRDSSAFSKVLKGIIVKQYNTLNDVIQQAGKSNIKAIDLPQLTQTIDRKVLEQQIIARTSELLQHVSGVYIMGNTGGYQEEIASRGFTMGSSNGFRNGVRFNNGIMPEYSNVEQVELLKGGNAMLYGNVSPGGILNFVTKKPRFTKGGMIGFKTGSFDLWKPTIDIYGPLFEGSQLAYRINAGMEGANSFRDKVSSHRDFISPSVLYQINDKNSLLIEAEFLNDTRTPDFGIGAINYTIPDVPRSNFLGTSWSSSTAHQRSVTTTFTQQINERWAAKYTAGYQGYERMLSGAARPASNVISSTGSWVRGLQKSGTYEKYGMFQADVTGTFYTDSIKHQLLMGAETDAYLTRSMAYKLTTFNNTQSNASIRGKNIYDTINIFAPKEGRQDIPDMPLDRTTTSPVIRYGFYVQDLISINKHLKFLAGLRYSFQENRTATVDTAGKTNKGTISAYETKALSPRAGIVYQPSRDLSIFFSYSNSFSPNSGTDINNAPLKPSIIDQFELGFKSGWFNGYLTTNVAAYFINNSDFAQSVIPAPASNPLARELAGAVQSKGIEIDLLTKPVNGFTIMGGYSHNDTRYTRSNIYKNGDRVRYNPRNTANLHVMYQFNVNHRLKGLSGSAGVYYVGQREAGRNTTAANPTYKLITVDPYTLLDLTLGYDFKVFSIRGKLSNVLNTLSYNLHDDNSVNPINPRMFTLQLNIKL